MARNLSTTLVEKFLFSFRFVPSPRNSSLSRFHVSGGHHNRNNGTVGTHLLLLTNDCFQGEQGHAAEKISPTTKPGNGLLHSCRISSNRQQALINSTLIVNEKVRKILNLREERWFDMLASLLQISIYTSESDGGPLARFEIPAQLDAFAHALVHEHQNLIQNSHLRKSSVQRNRRRRLAVLYLRLDTEENDVKININCIKQFVKHIVASKYTA